MKSLFVVCVIVSVGVAGCGKKKDDAKAEKADAKKDGKSNSGDSVKDKKEKAKQKEDKPKPDESTEKKATPLKVLSYDEIQKLIASHKGKVVVVDAWATYCQPCLKEFHNLVDIHKKYDADKVVCVSLSFDYGGDAKLDELKPRVQAFLDSQGATFDNIISSEPWETLYTKFDFEAVPAVFVYGTDGKLAERVEEDYESENPEPLYKKVKALVEKLAGEKS